MVGLKDIFGFITSLAWPLVVAVTLFGFRKSIVGILEQIARRATKLSITSNLSIELPLPEVTPLEVNQLLPAEFEFIASALNFASEVSVLLRHLETEKTSEVLIIDLGTGKQWLTSRLFIFTVILQRLHGLRSIVFLETQRKVPRQFLFMKRNADIRWSFIGIASPLEIQQALVRKYPWLEKADIRAQNDILATFGKGLLQIQSVNDSDQFEIVHRFLDVFLEQVQIYNIKSPNSENMRELTLIEDEGIWERAKWIDGTLLEMDLGSVLQKDACFKDSPNISQAAQIQAILERNQPFIALINQEGVFKRLINREVLLEQIAAKVGTALKDQSLTK